MHYKIPDSIDTNDPREAISFCIANGIEEGILPENFNLSEEAYDIITSALIQVWDEMDSFVLNQIMIAFVAGYAAGKGQVKYNGN